MADQPSWLDKLLRRVIAKDGEPVPMRGTLDFAGSLVSVTDVPDENVTRVRVGPSGGAAPPNGSVLIVRDGEIVLEPMAPADLGIDLQGVSWTPNVGEDQGDGTRLVERGSVINETVAPTSVSVVDTFANGAVQIGASDWTFDEVFEDATTTFAVETVVADASADPSWTSTARVGVGILATAPQSFTVFATSQVYVGKSAFEELGERYPSPSGFYGYANPGGGNQAGIGSVLSRSRDIPEVSLSFADEYLWVSMPARSQYGGTSLTIDRSGGGDAIAMQNMGTLSITRAGVTRVYRAWRSVDLITDSIDFTIS
jgi:hypothetical protein